MSCLVFSIFLCKKKKTRLLLSQHLKLPGGSLVFVIQAVGVEVELPRGCLIFIVQAVCRSGVEAEARGTVALSGRLVQVAGNGAGAHGAEGGGCWRGQLVVHGRQV